MKPRQSWCERRNDAVWRVDKSFERLSAPIPSIASAIDSFSIRLAAK
jgi:hypothetical protein